MKLTQTQRSQYDRDGYLFFESLLTADELQALSAAVPGVTDPTRVGVKREEGSDAVRMVHGAHLLSGTVAALARHPRLLEPSRAVLDGDDVYLFQSRLVLKEPLDGAMHAGFPWHQDFSTWYLLDRMPEPRAVVVAIFLDEVTALNAPIFLIPGSHRRGLIGEGSSDPEAYAQIIIDRPTLEGLVAEGGMRAMTGPPGSVLFMHCNTVHASPPNISTFRRAIYYVIYNSTANRCVNGTRQPHYSGVDYTPLTPLETDSLLHA